MSSHLACSWAFAPWRHEGATTAAAWLTAAGRDGCDVIRADLDAVVPRETPRPAIDATLGRTASLPGADRMPLTWAQLEAYAEAAVTTSRRWAGDDGWADGYSGPVGLVDHLVMALLRSRSLVGRWTAHVIDLPTHEADGSRRLAEVTDGPLREVVTALPGMNPRGPLVADWIVALIATADEVLVGTPALANALELPQARVWQRPGVLVPPGYRRERTPGLICALDPARLATLGPVLTAYGMLSEAEMHRLPLHLVTNDPGAIGAELRRRGLEARVTVSADSTPMVRTGADWALVLDLPRPDGMPWSPAGIPELADHTASGTPVILVCEQDSPLSRLPVAYHAPTDHPSAVFAVLRRLAATAA